MCTVLRNYDPLGILPSCANVYVYDLYMYVKLMRICSYLSCSCAFCNVNNSSHNGRCMGTLMLIIPLNTK